MDRIGWIRSATLLGAAAALCCAQPAWAHTRHVAHRHHGGYHRVAARWKHPVRIASPETRTDWPLRKIGLASERQPLHLWWDTSYEPSDKDDRVLYRRARRGFSGEPRPVRARQSTLAVVGRLHLVTVSTAANPIVVDARYVRNFVGLTAALVARGFRGTVHCFAAHGHVRNSLHHTGDACDFAQTGWDRTVPIMYHSTALIESFGLRDGCTFRHPRRDCGHVDIGFAPRRRYARADR